jgi:uncharacterized protein
LSQPSNKGHELRVNVGFLLKETAGYSRTIQYESEHLLLDEDLAVNDLDGAVRFTRTHDGLLTRGRITADVEVECSRCLTGATQPVSADIEELWYYPPEKAPEDAEWVIQEDANLDLTPLVREHFLLGIPIQVLCRPDCRGLCPQCGQDLNQGPCDCAADTIDPRLSALGTLLDDSAAG